MQVILSNKKAYFEYTILDKYIAGIELFGNEVKSIRQSNISVAESYCQITGGEMFILGLHISEYMNTGAQRPYDPVRPKKLLLNRKEINKIQKATTEKGLTIVPLGIILSPTGFIKIEIGVARGKKVYDKRVTIKEREEKRNIQNL